jgi:hypothetical protein
VLDVAAKDWIRIRDAAEMIGCTTSYVYCLAHRGALGEVHIDAEYVYLVRRGEVEAWLAARARKEASRTNLKRESDGLLTPVQVARMLGVTRQRVLELDDLLHPLRLPLLNKNPKYCRRRYRREDVERYLDGHQRRIAATNVSSSRASR